MKAVTCLKWIERGVAKATPDKIKLTDEELKDLIKDMKHTALSEEDTSDEDNTNPRKRKVPQKTDSKNNERKEASQDTDDEESDTEEEADNPVSMAGIAYYASQSEDPHISKDPDSDDEEILPNDNLIAVGKVNKDFCNLEIYVYNEEEDHCWCHHDYILPTIPLCLEWLSFDPTAEAKGNFVAIGSMGPDIEIWDLDVLDTLEPSFVLAGKETGSKKKKKKKSGGGHTDAILDLSWNRILQHILASASADFTIRLWDIENGQMKGRFKHDEKVQSLQWNPSDAGTLLSASADKRVRLFDCRNEELVQLWSLNGEVENVLWSNDDCFFASTDSGYLYHFDKRQKKPLYEVGLHNESITGISLCSKISGCLVTSSADKTVKVWDTNHGEPKHIFTKDLKIGQLFCVSGCPDSSLIFGIGGERELKVLNLKKNPVVADHFGIVGTTKGSVDVPIGESDEDNDSEDDIQQPEKENSGPPEGATARDFSSESSKKNKKKKKKKSK